MSKMRSFIAGIFGRGNEKEKVLLATPEGSLFHSLILSYIRIFVQSQEPEKNQSTNKEKVKKKKEEKWKYLSFSSFGGSNTEDNGQQSGHGTQAIENDPLAVLLHILSIAPRISSQQMEEECIRQDILQFLKIISHQFTSHIISNEEQNRIHFREPHLLSTTSLITDPSQASSSQSFFQESGPYVALLHTALPKLKKKTCLDISENLRITETKKICGWDNNSNGDNKRGRGFSLAQKLSRGTDSKTPVLQSRNKKYQNQLGTDGLGSSSPRENSVSQRPDEFFSKSGGNNNNNNNNNINNNLTDFEAERKDIPSDIETESANTSTSSLKSEVKLKGKVKTKAKQGSDCMYFELQLGGDKEEQPLLPSPSSSSSSSSSLTAAAIASKEKTSEKKDEDMGWWTEEWEGLYHKKRDMFYRLTHPLKYDGSNPYGALLSLFEQFIVECEHSKVKQERIDVMNQYGCLASCLWRLLCIVSPRNEEEMRAIQKRDKDLGEHLPSLIKRLLKLALEIFQSASSALELVRSSQLQPLFVALVSPWTDETYCDSGNSNMFAELTTPTISCVVLSALANAQVSILDDIHKHIYKKQYIRSVLKVLATRPRYVIIFLSSF
ncbi:putative sialophosphoprotein [Reticulomyxa filosa]|uniref:Putative sialophosphoprotein n=1 Tax=Reticulomyxa filosa TaxID=46433 RepID=X6MQW1_RETFI|nr:putative sialophosphoprotein [Reticulomyxa filosa]|eukprot:ETO15475.1 putative sialophosphoprotein [Reticulomyxa filosa]